MNAPDRTPGVEASPFAESRRWSPRKGPVERGAEMVCQAALVLMMAMIGAEVVVRTLAGYSFEVTDELGGYLLVTVTFLSFSVCHVEHSYHRVELIQARLSERARAWSELLFDLLSFGFAATLLWQTARLALMAWSNGETAPTNLMTPLWIPYLSMPLGSGLLCVTLLRALVRDVQRLAAGPTWSGTRVPQ